MEDKILHGVDPLTAADALHKWFENMPLGWNKKLVPLGYNYQFDIQFLKSWLGSEHYEVYFDHRYRDAMLAALYVNDNCYFNSEPIPFPKLSLTYVASQLGVEYGRAHDALEDCRITAEVYRRMITKHCVSFKV